MIITFANLKGGIGKTTSSIHAAEILSEMGKSVLLIDTDPQANLTSSYDIDFEQMKKNNIMTALGKNEKSINKSIIRIRDNFDIIPATIKLADFESNFASEYGKELLLKTLIHPALYDKYDYIVIDTPPSLGIITRNALLCSETLVIPVDPHVWAIEAGMKLINNIKQINKSALKNENSIKNIYILPIRQKVIKSYERDLLKAIKENFKNEKILPPISNSEDMKKSQSLGFFKKGKIYKEYKTAIMEIING